MTSVLALNWISSAKPLHILAMRLFNGALGAWFAGHNGLSFRPKNSLIRDQNTRAREVLSPSFAFFSSTDFAFLTYFVFIYSFFADR